eukprot:5633359-Pleurochrysis_carterae.AAC.2
MAAVRACLACARASLPPVHSAICAHGDAVEDPASAAAPFRRALNLEHVQLPPRGCEATQNLHTHQTGQSA